jgi:hypothetical protein
MQEGLWEVHNQHDLKLPTIGPTKYNIKNRNMLQL